MFLPPELLPKRYFNDYYSDDDEFESDEEFLPQGRVFQPEAIVSMVQAINVRSLDSLSREIQRHLDAGKSLDYDDYMNRVPLVEACIYRWVEGVKLLLEKGADANVEDELSTPIFACCIMNSSSEEAKCASLLLEHGADPNFQNRHGMKPLMAACQAQAATVVDVLLSCSKVDVHAKDPYGRTALFFAESSGNTSIVEKLLQAGIDPLVKAYDGTIAENHRPEVDPAPNLEVSYIFSDLTSTHQLDFEPEDDDQRIKHFLSQISSGLPDKAMEISGKRCLAGTHLLDILSFDEEKLKRCGLKLSYHRRELMNLLRSAYLLPWSSNAIPPQALQNELSLQAIGGIVCGTITQLLFMQGVLNNLKQTIPTRSVKESQKTTLIQLVDFFTAQRNLKLTLLKLKNELRNVEKCDTVANSRKSSWFSRIWNVIITSIAAPIRYIMLKSGYD